MSGNSRVEFRVLGPIEVAVDGVALPIGGAKQRGLLALLLTEANRVVSTNRMVEALWGEDAPDRATSTLQVHVSNLRKALAPAAEALGIEEVVRTQRPGYVVSATAVNLDLLAFRDLVASAQQSAVRNDALTASQQLTSALSLVRGQPLADLVDEPFAASIALHLEQLIARAHEARFETELMAGHHREILADIEARITAEPLNEHLRALQMLALYRCGRQADALAVYQNARNVLVEELGVDPSPELRELESRVLAQDPVLDSPATAKSGVDVRAETQTVLRSSVLVPLAVLVLDTGDGRTVPLTRAVVTIGRREGNDVVIDDAQVSRVHAEIRLDSGGFVLVDCRSTNGTRVNGTKVDRRALESGDEISIGDQKLRFAIVEQ